MAPLRSTLTSIGFSLLASTIYGAAVPSSFSRSLNALNLNDTTAWNATAWNTSSPTPVATPIPSASIPSTAEPTESCDKSYWVNHLVFEVSLDEFIEYRNANNLSCISAWDWSSDGCTKVPDGAFGADFHGACLRHDFGYGGYSTLCTLDHDKRESVDKRFSHDLEDACEKLGWWDGLWCTVAKQTYYDGVRAAGRLFAPECDTDHVKRSK